MRLGLDMDDVIADYISQLLSFHNVYYGTKHSFKDYITYDHELLWGCSLDEANRRHLEFRVSKYFQRIVPVEGAVEGVQALRRDHQLVIISARPEKIRTATEEWLNNYFKGIFNEIHLTNQYEDSGKKRTKAEVCRKIGIELLVEDALEHAEPCEAENIPLLLYNRPWNQNGREEYRIHSWPELVQVIKHWKTLSPPRGKSVSF